MALSLLSVAGTQAQTYAPYVSNPYNLSGVGGMVEPTFADLDNDGDLDLFTGSNAGPNGAEVVYFENTGTRIAPQFAAGIMNPFGLPYVGGILSPSFVDLDNDGDLDLFCGNQSGMSNYFENTGTASAPVFAAPIVNPFGLYGVGYLSSHTFTDIDNDGDKDVLIGEYYGPMYYFPNNGTAQVPSFGPHQTLPFGLSVVGNAPKPVFMDMDKDGDQDLLVGVENGSFVYFQNTGTTSAPVFAAPVINPFGLSTLPQIYAAPFPVDLDMDEDLDILCGDNSNVFQYFQNTSPLPQPPAPVNSTPAANLEVCYGTSASLTATGKPIGTLGWYDAPSGGNFLGNGSPFTTPILTANKSFYVQDSTAGGVSASRITITVSVSQPISNQSVTADQTLFCGSGNTGITLGASETGVLYTLRNNLNDTVVAGPLAGTGSAITFSTGTISGSITYSILAQKPLGAGATLCSQEMAQTPTVTIKQPGTLLVSVNLCYGDNYTYADGTVAGNISHNASHISTLTGQAANGCDSLVTENIVSLPELTGFFSPTLCAEESMTVNGTVYNAAHPSGTEVFTGVGPNGCDSTVTVSLNLLPALTGSVTSTLCAEESVTINGTVYNATHPSGTEIFTNVGPNGCDSTVSINLTVFPALTGSVTAIICAEESLNINGTVYNAANPSGTEVFTNIGMYGCDSTVTVNLTVLPALTGSVNVAICPGQSVNINGTEYNATHLSGTEVFANTGPNGCDSTVTVGLTLNPAVDVTTTTAGNVITANQNGATYGWINCANNTPITGASAQTFTPVENGSYAVVVTDVCSDTSACVSIVTLGIETLSADVLFRTYPNPSNGSFTVDVNEPVSLKITNVAGQTILTRTLAAGQTHLLLENVESGIYFVSATNSQGRTFVQRVLLIKQ